MAGHRLLLVHLFLPDTLSFHDWAQEDQNTHYRAPSQQLGSQAPLPAVVHDAPPSPPTGEGQVVLPVHELETRLAQASGETTKDGKVNGEDDVALSDSESPAPVVDIPRRTRSARSSFNEQNKKVSMSLLMSEAAQGGSTSGSGSNDAPFVNATRSRRASPSGGIRPTILTQSPTNEGEKLPVATASDHGRAAASGSSPSHGTTSLPVQASTASSLSAIGHRSRRGSTSGLMNPFQSASSSLSMTSAQPPSKESSTDGQGGTRAPGALAGGKAGTMTPLSIIGDLAAKQSAIQPRQMPTPGDSERHHPFGSGAVTPLRGSQTPGPSRTPGNAPRPFLQQVLSKTPMSLLPARAGETQERGHRHGDGSSSMRPPQLTARHALGRVASAKDGWMANDNGREAKEEVASPAPAPSQHSSSDGPDSRSALRQRQASPALKLATSISSNTGPPAAPSAGWSRSSTKGRTQSRTGLGRRPSTLGGRVPNRRESSASLDLSVHDEAVLDGSPPLTLPPFDFAPNPSSNGGLINAVTSLARDRLRSGKVYIGTPGISMESWAGDKERRHMSERFRTEKNSVPVWVDDSTFEGAYNHFCKQILWPTFHYTLPTQKGLDNEHESFRNYRRVNESFADAIVREYREGDIIWINDYHLLLVPMLVREQLPHATIGFFLHIAFPSSEIFRCLSVRRDILRGMLGADLIGFQTHNFCRHFRQTVSRILQLEATPKGIQMDGQGGFVTVAPFPIGIDVRSLNRRRAEADVGEWVEKLQTRYEGKKVIVGRDKLDWIKGVRQKLLAFEIFLSEHPEWVGKVVLIQVALATTEENEEVGAATDVIARINNKYSTLTYQPVVFLHVQDITFSQYLALLTVADAFLASSLREGMNLTSHEYVVCQEEKHRPLILSEFTGTYSALRACIGINPWNTKQMAHAIYKAITMPDEEAFERWKDLHRQVVTQTAQHWIQSLLGRLERAHINQERRNNFFIPRLEIGQLVSEWRASKSRLLLFDLEDALLEEDDDATNESQFEPPEAVVSMLQDLCADARNRIYLLSGRGSEDLNKFVSRIPRIGLVAENGCAVMYAGEPREGEDKEWTSLVAGTNMSWRGPVKEILSYFTERTPGSWLEDRGASILWRFWSNKKDGQSMDCREFQWSRRQAAEVQNLIYDSLGERFSLRIIPGQTSFLIMPKNTSRASAIQHVVSLSHIGQANPSLTTSGSFSSTHGRSPHFSPRITPLDKHQSEKVSRDSSTFKQPSNDWVPSGRSRSRNYASSRPLSTLMVNEDEDNSFESRALSATNPYSLHPNGMGSFDFVLCIGQDDMLLSYINSLDLPFAPITCTSSYCDEKSRHNSHAGSSEANYYLNGVQDVFSSLEEIVAFKGRDQRWGLPATLDV